jgi:hypothetical protein
MFLLLSGNVMESLEYTEKVKTLYNYEKHSKDLVHTYGNDRIPYTIAMNAQGNVLIANLSSDDVS